MSVWFRPPRGIRGSPDCGCNLGAPPCLADLIAASRRSDVIGIFPNDEAIIRLVGALMLETDDDRTVARRCMSLETLARVTDTPTVGVPAVAS